MRMFLVDHGYGAALVYAGDEDEAADIGDRIGQVEAVYPFNIPLAFHINREKAEDDENITEIVMALAGESDCDEQIEALLKKRRVALTAEEFDRLGYVRPEGMSAEQLAAVNAEPAKPGEPSLRLVAKDGFVRTGVTSDSLNEPILDRAREAGPDERQRITIAVAVLVQADGTRRVTHHAEDYGDGMGLCDVQESARESGHMLRDGERLVVELVDFALSDGKAPTKERAELIGEQARDRATEAYGPPAQSPLDA